MLAHLQALGRQIEHGFARLDKRAGRIERDLIDLKTHHGVQRRPPLSGRQNENDEPTAVVNADF